MKVNIHESLYDLTEDIYKNIYKGNIYMSDDYMKLNNIISEYTDIYIENLSIYQKNQILLHYGIDNAFKKYIEKYNIAIIDKENFTNIIIKNLLIDTFTIININN
jgi:hypothetical protein